MVIIGGLAELFSGAISMGLGAYLAAVTDRDLYESEERRERDEVINKPEAERAEIYEIFEEYDIGHEDCKSIVQALERNPENWVKVWGGDHRGDFFMWWMIGLMRGVVHDDVRTQARKAEYFAGVDISGDDGRIILHRCV